MTRSYIAVDLDGTLAEYDGWKGPTHIGAPVPAMVDRVRSWLKEGKKVKIFTARVCGTDGRDVAEVRGAIQRWCFLHIGQTLEVTNEKDYEMVVLYDDRARQVEFNTGRIIGEDEECDAD